MTAPLVSAIIPTFRRPMLVGRSCRSVFAQTHRPLELIVIDDGSGDDTPQVIAALQPEADAAGVNLQFISNPNGGPGRARNAGVAVARGEYFAFLDDDDLWLEAKVATQLAAMQDAPEAGLAFTQFVHEGSPDHPKPGPDKMKDGWCFETLCNGQTRAHLQTLMVTRAAWQQVGGFAPLFNFEDSEFLLRLALMVPFLAVPKVLTTICTPGQATVSREAGLEGDIKRDRGKLEVLREFATRHESDARYSAAAMAVLRARIFDEHIKHLIWLGRVGDARLAWRDAIRECGDQPLLARLKGKLFRARVAGWFGIKLRKP